MTEQPEDTELVRRAIAAKGDRQALTEVFAAISDRHRDAVLRWCARMLPNPQSAQDVGQEALTAAFELLAEGKAPAEPAKLGGWLIEIARLRRLEYLRKDQSRNWAPLPANQTFEDLGYDDEARSGGATRRAHALRIVDAVVATLTDRQQEIYRLRFQEELTGRQIAERLRTTDQAITEKAASNEATLVQALVAIGFGSLVLAREGRPYCPDLARILDEAQFTNASAVFTAQLRERIVHHFDTCRTCDNCRTCNDKQRQLVGPYVPVLIPLLFGPEFAERVSQTIHHVSGPRSHGDRPRRRPPRGRRPPRRIRLGRASVSVTAAVVVILLAVAATTLLSRASSPSRPGQAGGTGASAPPALAYTTATSVVLRPPAGPSRVVGTFPAGQGPLSLAWSSDGKQLAWLSGTQISIAQASGGSVRSWPCTCLDVSFLAGQAVTVSQADAGGSLTAAVPRLLAFPASRAAPSTIAITGIPAVGLDTDFRVMTDLPSGDLVVAYGSAGGSNLGGPQLLYRVDPSGHATPYGLPSLADVTISSYKVSGLLGNATTAPKGNLISFTTTSRGGACGEIETAYALSTATGAITIPTLPAGGGPDGFWVQSLWFDQIGNAYAAFIPNLTDCATSGNPATAFQPANAKPIVCELERGAWIKTAIGVIRVGYAPGGWLARQTGGFSGTIEPASPLFPLIISHGHATITIPGVYLFAWAT